MQAFDLYKSEAWGDAPERNRPATLMAHTSYGKQSHGRRMDNIQRTRITALAGCSQHAKAPVATNETAKATRTHTRRSPVVWARLCAAMEHEQQQQPA